MRVKGEVATESDAGRTGLLALGCAGHFGVEGEFCRKDPQA